MQKSTSKVSGATFPHLNDTIDATMLANRRLFIGRQIDGDLAEEIIRKIWYLEHADPSKKVTLVISSPGGSVDAGFAIWDQLKMMSFPLVTVVTGLAASMASILALCAPRGSRFATPKSRFLIHQPAINTVIEGQATDLEIQAKEILKTKKEIVALYCEATQKNQTDIEKALDRDTWMTAEEALSFGLIDKLVNSYAELE